MNTDNEMVCLGSAGITVFDQNDMLKTGKQTLTLWPLKAFPKDISCYGQNHMFNDQTPKFRLKFKFKTFNDVKKYGRQFDPRNRDQMYKFQQ